MNRQEHLSWCKNRANEYVDAGELGDAWASMLSDMGKHEDTRRHSALDLGTSLLVMGHLSTPHLMRKFIEGFN